MQIPGFETGERLYESANSIIHRAVRVSDGRAVVIKLLPSDFPSADDVARFRREYEMTQRLAGDGIIEALDLVRVPNGLAIALEDFGASALSDSRHADLTLDEKLAIGIEAAHALGRVHAVDIIHKDINPSNILLHRGSGQVKLIDFGISTELRREPAATVSPHRLEGTLAYVSPEQTGRTSRPLDYRSDLYSLGCTLHHLLSGRPPFQGADALELVHCHLALRPEPLDNVPAPVARLVSRLMEKDPEARYQSAEGVARDLARCRASLAATGTVEDFEIGADDVSDRFSIPERLYGRAAEIDRLLAAFDGAAGGRAQLCLVAGYSGIGKSALVREVHRPIVERRGYFVSGKFDQFQRDVPYASLVQAFTQLVRRILSEPAGALAVWSERLRDAVGVNGQVIVDVIPDVERIIGAQEPVAPLAPMEARNRFNLVFEAFVHAFADAAHPLAVFLDDLQWADGPSLGLIRRLAADPESKHLLLIGAYRDNEVDATHPLVLMLGELRESGAAVSTITLSPLPRPDVAQLVADTMHCPVDEIAELVDICLDKTGGNPFFLKQLLTALYEMGALAFDRPSGRWTWDADKTREAAISDNVVELMVRKIRTLSDDAQNALRYASCIGATFDLHTLAVATETEAAEARLRLWPALTSGLVQPLGADYRLFQEDADDAAGSPRRTRFRWLHDRVQQAAYSLMNEDDSGAVHGRVGRAMLAHLSEGERDDRIFEIVGHLNRAGSTFKDDDERLELVDLNLRAGRRGIASAAYEPAAHMLERGLALLADTDGHRGLALELHQEAANAYLLVPDFEAMDRHLDAVLALADGIREKVRAYEVRILACQARAMVEQGVATALEILAELGVAFPAEPGAEDVGAWLGKVAAAIGDREIEALLDVPENPDPEKVAAIRLLVNITSTAYIGAPALFPLIVLEAVALSAEGGDTGASAYAYVTYGIILCGVLDQFDAGYRFGQLGQDVVAKYDAREYAARTRYIPDCFIRLWGEHQRLSWASHPETYVLGLETGDQEFAAWPLMKRTHQGFFMGLPLPGRVDEARGYVDACLQLGQETSGRYLQETLQAMLGLMGQTDDPLVIRGEEFDEDVFLPRFVEASEAFGICNHYVLRIFLAFLFERPDTSPALAAALAPWSASMVSLIHVPVFHLYHSLNLLELARRGGPDADAQMEFARTSLARLDVWRTHAPENFAHRYAILDGQIACVEARYEDARAAFKSALSLAREHGYLHEEAVANELLGKLWLERDEEEVAGLYLARARHGYALWGASAKVEHLDAAHGARYPRQSASFGQGVSPLATVTTTTTGPGLQLDLDSVIKACQAISSEVHRDALEDRLLSVLLENVGAERGVLILPRGTSLLVAARTTAGRGVDRTQVALEEAKDLPRSIVHYVDHARDSVVLEDAAADPTFGADPYIAESGARSVLCAPILRGGVLAGIFYFENNLSAGAFTPDRLEVLSLLSAQVSISLENADLVGNLEAKVEERTRALRAAHEQIIVQEKLASLGSLTAGIAHELQNPLNFINNFSEVNRDLILEARELNPSGELAELLDDLDSTTGKIHDHGARAAGIIRGMLAHATHSTGERRACSFNDLVGTAADLAVHAASAQGDVTLTRSLGPDASLVVDEGNLRRALINIIDNAIDAVRGTETPHVEVTTGVEGPWFVVCIRDHGPGIPAEVQEQLFEPFFTTKPPGQGTGLGLSLAYDIIVQGHQGEVTASSPAGGPTEFMVRLPR